MKKFLAEFKEFAMKGNVLDMAIGVVIGGAFGKIVTSLVNDIIMPLVGVVTGGGSFDSLNILLRPDETNPLTLNYGSFIQTTIDFLIIAMSIFVAIKAINKFSKKQEVEVVEEAPTAPSEEVILLQGILEELKSKK